VGEATLAEVEAEMKRMVVWSEELAMIADGA
jgi:hypothetical protein